jgi:hypothetical protein
VGRQSGPCSTSLTPRRSTPSSTGSWLRSTASCPRPPSTCRRARATAGLHRLPTRVLDADLVQQRTGTAQPRDPPAHRCRRHLPRPGRRRPARRRRPGRAERRVDRATPLPRPQGPSQSPTARHRRQHHHGGGDRPRDACLEPDPDHAPAVSAVHHDRGLGPRHLQSRRHTALMSGDPSLQVGRSVP